MWAILDTEARIVQSQQTLLTNKQLILLALFYFSPKKNIYRVYTMLGAVLRVHPPILPAVAGAVHVAAACVPPSSWQHLHPPYGNIYGL